MAKADFERSVFINCPLDREYEPILQAILFCIIYLGLIPRIATERADSGETRVNKIRELIEESKYSIHDLSRCQAKQAGEHYRLNMPFELGLDYGCRQYFGKQHAAKRILILEEESYRYQAALSDLAGCDIAVHTGDYQKAVRKVRNWLVSEAGVSAPGASKVLGDYVTFQEWYYERQLAAGFSEGDIQDYPTSELMEAMTTWARAGKPI